MKIKNKFSIPSVIYARQMEPEDENFSLSSDSDRNKKDSGGSTPTLPGAVETPIFKDSEMLNFSPLDQYLYVLMQNMIDDVCLQDARIEKVKTSYTNILEEA
jgi:hypothetical protein